MIFAQLIGCPQSKVDGSSLAALGVDDGASQGLTIQQTATPDKSVQLKLDTGAQLDIPRGAVVENVPIRLERPSDARALTLIDKLPQTAGRVVSAPYVVRPHGQRFEEEVTVTLPLATKSAQQVSVAWLEDENDTEWKSLGVPDTAQEMARIKVKHFSVFMLVENASSLTSADAGEGDAGEGDAGEGDAGADVTDMGNEDAGRDAGSAPDVGAPELTADAGPDLDAGPDTSPRQDELAFVLIAALGRSSSDFVANPHTIELLRGDGSPFDPFITTTSGSGTGKFTLMNVPAEVLDRTAWIHVVGKGPASDANSTYDALTLLDFHGQNPALIRVSTVNTASYAAATGAFTPRADRTALQGTVYLVDATGRWVGSVGCAEVWIDDQPSPYADYDQRYVASRGLPAPVDRLSQTLAGSGKFFFGNVPKGKHTFKVTVDHGQTFVGDPLTLDVPLARMDASGDDKDLLTQFAIDVGGKDPTPTNCPATE